MTNELQLPEFTISKKEKLSEDTVLYTVHPKELPPACPLCGSVHFVKNGKINRLTRDLPAFGCPSTISAIVRELSCEAEINKWRVVYNGWISTLKSKYPKIFITAGKK